jgi:hypothetical protein
MLCPQCGVQVGTHIPDKPVPLPPADDGLEEPAVGRRFLLGAIALLGLYLGLKHIAWAFVLSHPDAGPISDNGWLCLLVGATLVAAMVAGTVNRWAEVTGVVLGLGAAAGFLWPDFARGERPSDAWLVGLGSFLGLIGLAGGFAGRLFMAPAPSLPRIAPGSTRSVAIKRRSVPLSWIPILIGATLAVAMTILADDIRTRLSRYLAVNSQAFGGATFLTWQVSILGALFGGFAAGLNTRNAARQGIVCGLLAAAGALVITVMMDPTTSVVVAFWSYQVDQKEVGPLVLALLGASIWIVTAIGGWLGGQLSPPRRRK